MPGVRAKDHRVPGVRAKDPECQESGLRTTECQEQHLLLSTRCRNRAWEVTAGQPSPFWL